MKRIVQINGVMKEAIIAIAISDKVAFKAKLTREDRKEYFILIKGKSTKSYTS